MGAPRDGSFYEGMDRRDFIVTIYVKLMADITDEEIEASMMTSRNTVIESKHRVKQGALKFNNRLRPPASLDDARAYSHQQWVKIRKTDPMWIPDEDIPEEEKDPPGGGVGDGRG